VSATPSDHPAGAPWGCRGAPARLSHPDKPQRLRLRARAACARLHGPGHVCAARAPDRHAGAARQPGAPVPRFSPPLCPPDAMALVSTRRRCGASPARPLDLPRAGQGQRHVLGLERHPRVAQFGHGAPGAGAQETPVLTTPIAFPTLLETFFTDRLVRQKRASPHTIASYRATFSLLRRLTQQHRGKAPLALTRDELDVPLLSALLDALEHTRGTSARSRNGRLAAMHAFFH
jgi:hypothetical protein